MGENDFRNVIKVGSVGYEVGNSWDEKGNTEVVQIFLSHGEELINSIQFQYFAENGNLVLSDRYGTNIGSKFDAVRLNYPDEYITWISGQKGTYSLQLCSIKIGTNLGEYGPFGQPTNRGKESSFRLGQDRQFGGFYGTADNAGVKSIGVYLKPIMNLDCSPKRNIIELTEDGEH